MSAAIISDNTTIKNTTMPKGSVSTNGSQQTLFQTPTNTNYKITHLIFSVAPGVSRPIVLFDNSSAPEVLANVYSFPNGTDRIVSFNPPIELSGGQGLRLNGDSVGLYNANWSAVGTATVNTP